jgi:hypothetical protein
VDWAAYLVESLILRAYPSSMTLFMGLINSLKHPIITIMLLKAGQELRKELTCMNIESPWALLPKRGLLHHD